MFKNLIPWKRRHNQLTVHRDEPTYQSQASDSLTQMRQEFDSLLSRFFDDQWLGSQLRDWPRAGAVSPFRSSLDMGWEEQGDAYVLRAEVPGFEPEDFDVKISGKLLTVEARHQEEKDSDNNGKDRRYGWFKQTVTLPYAADDTRIDARYHSGILELHLPKTEDARSKRIEVKAG
jgi:HSP20 family protein